MMYCGVCGAVVEDNAKFCGNCGAPVIPLESENPTNTVESSIPICEDPLIQEPAVPARPHLSKKAPGVRMAICTALVALVAFGGWFYLRMQNNQLNQEWNMRTESIAQSDIAICNAQADQLEEAWQALSFFDLEKKRTLLAQMTETDTDAQSCRTQLDQLDSQYKTLAAELDQCYQTSSYGTLEQQLETLANAIEVHQDPDEAQTILAQAKAGLTALQNENQDYIGSRLQQYQAINMAQADVQDKAKYDTWMATLQKIAADKSYSQLEDALSMLDSITAPYVEPAQILQLLVQQVDATDYPNVKLYLQIEDPLTGQVPDSLEDSFFYIRKQDANRNYVSQQILNVSQLNELEALNIDMVADVSGSMNGAPLQEAKGIMTSFIQSVQFSAGDLVELTTFSDGVYLEQEFTDDAQLLSSQVHSLTTGDMTSLYDALYTAVTRVAARPGAKCVIAFTDGLDNYSSCTADDVVAIAQRYQVPIFIIGIGGNDYSSVQYIANQTGGSYYQVDHVDSMEAIYEDVYRQQKELYMLEFQDSSGAAITDASELLIGYNSTQYGGKTEYNYTPNVLINVQGPALFSDGPEAVVEAYMKAFDDAVTENNFSHIQPYLLSGSAIYTMQQKFVQQKIEELLDSYEIVSVDYTSNDQCIVTTRETYYVQTPNTPLHLLTQQCKYIVVRQNGQWFLKDFAEHVQVLSKINQ